MKIKIKCLLVLLGLVAMVGACSQQPKPKSIVKNVRTQTKKVRDTVEKIIITEPDLRKLVAELNMRLMLYDSIYPMSDYTTADVLRFKIPDFKRDSAWAIDDPNNKAIGGRELIPDYQIIIFDLLKKVLNHPAIVKYELGKILNVYDLIVSEDGRVYNLTLPEKNGGTYQSNLSWIHYRADDGKIYNYYPEQLIPEHDSISKPAFNTDGFSSITAIHTAKGTKYLFMGGVIGCSTCRSEYVELGYFDKGETILDFSFSIQSRFKEDDDDKGISYDVKTKTLRVDHTPSDLDAGVCSCSPGKEEDENGETIQPEGSINNTPIRHGKKLICVFKFDGSTFVLNGKQSREP